MPPSSPTTPWIPYSVEILALIGLWVALFTIPRLFPGAGYMVGVYMGIAVSFITVFRERRRQKQNIGRYATVQTESGE
jgi:positive regulator of sigma E activity